MRNEILLFHKHWKAGKQVGHPEQDSYGHNALGWESVRASRQGSGLVYIWLVNLLATAKRQSERILEVLTQYFTETYLHYNVFQVGSKTIILTMRNPWHFVLENKAVYLNGMPKEPLDTQNPLR